MCILCPPSVLFKDSIEDIEELFPFGIVYIRIIEGIELWFSLDYRGGVWNCYSTGNFHQLIGKLGSSSHIFPKSFIEKTYFFILAEIFISLLMFANLCFCIPLFFSSSCLQILFSLNCSAIPTRAFTFGSYVAF